MDKIDELLTRRVQEILPTKEGLEQKLRSGDKIRLYQGFDPTGNRLHLGHSIGMRNLQSFAELGHTVYAIFGTGTVLVGDPSGRENGRKLITQEEIEVNLTTWKEQASKVMDLDRIKVVFNGDWLVPLTLKDIVQIASNISAVQLFKRDNFQRRLDKGDTVWFHETLYPLLQGYDSVHLDVDLEIGGNDQTFNMLVGRELQKKINHREKWVLTNPMISGTDGGQMSKTSGNCVWLDDSAEDMYGKIMAVSDAQIVPYMRLLTNIPLEEIDNLPDDPMNNKKKLAFEIAKQFHGESGARQGQDYFETTFQKKGIAVSIPEITVPGHESDLLTLLESAHLGESNADRKRLIRDGAVSLNDQKITDPSKPITPKTGDIIKFGKHTFIKLIINS